jgi:ankyrin repeat protein
MCLIYLLSFDQPVQSSRYSLHFPFRLYALRQWHTHLHAAKVGESRTPEKDLVIRFFDPASVPYQNFLVDYNSRPILPVFGKRQPILPTLSHALWLSSLLGLFDVVESLLLSGVEITLNNRQDWTCYPLLAAAYRGHVGVVRLLLKHGANVNCYTAGYRYPLLVAALGEHVSTVQLLLNEGAQLNGVAPIQGRTIFAACQLGNIDGAQILLSHGANVNQEGGRWGKTPLQCAASSGSIELVRLMLRRGADVNFEGGYYCTALIAATNHGHEPIVQLLLENRANVDAQAHSLGTALHQAVVHGYKGIASLLKAKGGQDFDGTVE